MNERSGSSNQCFCLGKNPPTWLFPKSPMGAYQQLLLLQLILGAIVTSIPNPRYQPTCFSEKARADVKGYRAVGPGPWNMDMSTSVAWMRTALSARYIRLVETRPRELLVVRISRALYYTVGDPNTTDGGWAGWVLAADTARQYFNHQRFT